MIINLTPHDITIINSKTVTIKPSGLARCEETSEEIKLVEDWIPVFRTTYGKISGLPEPKKKYYLRCECQSSTSTKRN